jgi:hypothetical protein
VSGHRYVRKVVAKAIENIDHGSEGGVGLCCKGRELLLGGANHLGIHCGGF